MDCPPCFYAYNNVEYRQRSQTLQPIRSSNGHHRIQWNPPMCHRQDSFMLRKYFDSIKSAETNYANMPLDLEDHQEPVNLLTGPTTDIHHHGAAMMRGPMHHNGPGNNNTFTQHPGHLHPLMGQWGFAPHEARMAVNPDIDHKHHQGHHLTNQRHRNHPQGGIHNRSHSQHYYHTTYNPGNDYPSSNNYYNLSNAGHRSSVLKQPIQTHQQQHTPSRHHTPTMNNDHTNIHAHHQHSMPPASASMHQLNHHFSPGGHSPNNHQHHIGHYPKKVEMIAVLQVCTELGCLDTQPPTPSARNYSVTRLRDGNLIKVAYPQRRILKSPYVDRNTGLSLAQGSPVFVKGPSKEDRSKLSASYNDQLMDIPNESTHLPQPSAAPTLPTWAQ